MDPGWRDGSRVEGRIQSGGMDPGGRVDGSRVERWIQNVGMDPGWRDRSRVGEMDPSWRVGSRVERWIQNVGMNQGWRNGFTMKGVGIDPG